MARIGIWIGFVVSGVCFYVVFELVEFDRVFEAFRGANGTWITVGTGLTLAHFLVRNRRWQVIVAGDIGYLECLWAQGIGFLFFTFFPLKLNDVARTVVLTGRSGLSLWRVGTSVVMERFLDVLTTAVTLGAVALMVELSGTIMTAAVTLLAIALAGLVIMIMAPGMLGRLPFPWAKARFEHFGDEVRAGLDHLRAAHVMGSVLVWTILGWMLGISRHWFFLLAFVAGPTLIESTLLTATLGVASGLPSAPGGIGVFQLIGQQSLVLPFGDKYSDAAALAIAVVVHAAILGIAAMIGFLALWMIRHDFGVRRILDDVARRRHEGSETDR